MRDEYNNLDYCLPGNITINVKYDDVNNYLVDTSINIILAKCDGGDECAPLTETNFILDNYQFLGILNIK